MCAVERRNLEVQNYIHTQGPYILRDDYIDPDVSLASLPIVPFSARSLLLISSVVLVTSSNWVHTLRFSGRPIGNIDRASAQHSSLDGDKGDDGANVDRWSRTLEKNVYISVRRANAIKRPKINYRIGQVGEIASQ